MFRRALLVAVLGWLVAGCQTVGTQRQSLTRRTAPDSRQAGVLISSRDLKIVTEIPEGLDIPDVILANTRLTAWQTPLAASGHVWILIEASSPGGTFDRIYIDSDADGSLADEKGVKAHEASGFKSLFGPLQVTFETAEGPVTAHVNVACHEVMHLVWGGYLSIRIRLTSAAWYDGPVKIGGQIYGLRLVDGNSNGTYDDVSMDPGEADRIQIGGGGEGNQQAFAGTYIRIGGRLYHPYPATDGTSIAFEPAGDVPTGKVLVPDSIEKIAFSGTNGYLEFAPVNGVAEVPCGEWTIHSWSSSATDSEGVKWSLDGGGFPAQAAFEVSEQRETKLDVAASVVAKVLVSRVGSEYTFSEILEGRLGENVRVRREGGRAPVPRLRIESEDGSFLQILDFEYG